MTNHPNPQPERGRLANELFSVITNGMDMPEGQKLATLTQQGDQSE